MRAPGAERGVQDAVVGRLREVDAQVVGGHHRHLPDEGQRQQREHEHGDQAAAHHPVVAGHRDAGGELAPPAGPRRRLLHDGQRHHHERRHHEEVGGGVPREDPGRPDQGVQQAADDRPDDPGGVHLGRVQRNRARQVPLAHQPGQDGRVGRPEHRAAAAHAEHHDHEQDLRGVGDAATRATPMEKTSCSTDRIDEEALAVDLVRQQATHHGQHQRRAQLGEDDDADERGRVREVVGVGAQDDVLHPGADVRGEGTQEDDAEGPVRQGRPCGADCGPGRGCPRRRPHPRSPRARWPRRRPRGDRRREAAPGHGTGGHHRVRGRRQSRWHRTARRRPSPGPAGP